MTKELFMNYEMEKDNRFFLRSITVFNWGPFNGLHKPAEIDPAGTAVIGATGSGKTTLVDALMTLLVARPVYNLASTGGHDKNDRSVTSYVRGVKGMTDEAGGRDTVLRSGKTVTGISAEYFNGERIYTIGGLLWFDSHSSASSDLHKLWFINDNGSELLPDFLHLYNEGGRSALIKYAKESQNLFIFSNSKKQYLAQVRSFFEVGETAFDLLNRAAGLKQLNSINQIFRELVLDNNPQFDRALKVAEGFDSLEEIYQELLHAKEQVNSLIPIEQQNKRWITLQEEETQYRGFREVLPAWLARREIPLRKIALEELRGKKVELEDERSGIEQMEGEIQLKAQTLQAHYMQQGGAALEEIEKKLVEYREFLQKVTANAARYQRQAEEFQLGHPTSQALFEENLEKVSVLSEKEKAEREETQEAWIDLKAQNKALTAERQSLKKELTEASSRPKSNIPSSYQIFRDDLARNLNVKTEDLPYMAEMVEVKAEEREWIGAIERALGAERLRLLVPGELFSEAKRWVNSRDNKVHVRLIDISEVSGEGSPFEDSFIRKLNVEKESKYSDALYDILLRKDRHCADSVDVLSNQPFSMTKEGLMYDKGGRFEKQDQRPLKQGWMTGFDNRFLLDEIKQEIAEIERKLQGPLSQAQALKTDMDKHDARLNILNALAQYHFDDINLEKYERLVRQEDERLTRLNDPNSDLAKAKEEFDAAQLELDVLRKKIRKIEGEIGGVNRDLEKGEELLDEAEIMARTEISEELKLKLEEELEVPESSSLKELPTLRSRLERGIIQSLDSLIDKVSEVQGDLRASMEKAKVKDRGALSDVGSELVDIPEYLERLEYLRKEDLPERKRRFVHYLNESSTQGVTQLLEHIKNEVSKIQDRLQLLNLTLEKVDYKKGCYLQLDATEVGNDYLRAVDQAEKRHRRAVIEDQDDGDRRYHALKALIEIIREAATNNRKIASQALLDPRHRLEFFVREVNKETGEASGKITGSQTGSGGEKEQMASYILTASLSYALSPKGASRPKYTTVVLDEAFSKSSQSAATKIIEALKQFGLHPLFVTPNKEMSLLKSNTASAVLIHQATITSLKWRELDEIEAKRS